MKMKRCLSVLAAFAMVVTLNFTASAESTQFKMQDDFESYKESSDFLLYWAAQRKCNSVSLELDTNSVLNGKNSLRTDYNLDVKPGWATIIHYPNQENEAYSDALPSNCDGIKFTVKATCPMKIRVGIAFDYHSSQHVIYASPEKRTYTIRFSDMTPIDDPSFKFADATYLSNIDTVIFGEEQIQGFSRTGSVWYDDFYFFKGDDPTDLSTEAEALSHAPATTPAPTDTTAPNNDSTTAPQSEDPSSDTTTADPAETTDPAGSSDAESTADTSTTTMAGSSSQPDDGDSSGVGALPFIIAGIVVVVLAGGGVGGYFLYKKKMAAKPDESGTDDTQPPEN